MGASSEVTLKGYIEERNMEPSEHPTIVVTGFEPFGKHKVNASWKAVQCLQFLNVEEEFQVRLVIVEIPVVYERVEKIVPELWAQHKPLLMIHVGVSSVASELTLEKKAHRSGYSLPDVEGRVPSSGCCCLGKEEKLECALDVPNISLAAGHNACVSSNAGRFLCEYTYYISLCKDRRSLFIHVPELGKPYSAEELACGIKKVIYELLLRVRLESNESSNY